MLKSQVDAALAVGVGASVVLCLLPPIGGLAQLRVSLDVTALTGAPSMVFDLYNFDLDQFNGGASAGIQTPVTDNIGNRLTTAAVTTVGVVEIFSKWPANCREAVALVVTNTVASTGATVTVVSTVTEAAS